MNIEEFKKKTNQKRMSGLKKFEKEIFELINTGYSQNSICEFLKLNGVKTKQSNLSQFIHRSYKKKESVKIEIQKKPIEIQEQKEAKQSPTSSSLLKKSEVKTYEIVEPDYSKFNR